MAAEHMEGAVMVIRAVVIVAVVHTVMACAVVIVPAEMAESVEGNQEAGIVCPRAGSIIQDAISKRITK